MSDLLRYKGIEVLVASPDFEGYSELLCLDCMETIGKIPFYLLDYSLDSNSDYLQKFWIWLQKSRPSVIEHLEYHRLLKGKQKYMKKEKPWIRLIRG